VPRCCRLTVRRIHEAAAKSVEARVEQCCDARECVAADVPRSSSGASCDARQRARSFRPVRAVCYQPESKLTVHSLGSDIIRDFNAIDVETQPRNVAAWTPVVAEVLQGCVGFEDEAVSDRVGGRRTLANVKFSTHLPTLYPLVTDVLGREMQPEMRQSVKAFFGKVGRVQGLIPRRASGSERQ
jgi:hypothetical protein